MPNNILSVMEQQQIFSYRSRMNNIKSNFPEMKIMEYCVCNNVLTNEHLYECKYLKKNKNIPDYNKIFNGNIHEQKIISNTMEENYKLYMQHTPSDPK